VRTFTDIILEYYSMVEVMYTTSHQQNDKKITVMDKNQLFHY